MPRGQTRQNPVAKGAETKPSVAPAARRAGKRESKVERAQRAKQVCEALARAYPDAHCELDFRNPIELLIATILSAQCTDKRVNIVTKDLFRRCRTAKDYAEIPTEELEKLIQSTGFFRSKAKSIRSCSSDLGAKHGGKVPRTMDELHALAGVGRKTANVVL